MGECWGEVGEDAEGWEHMAELRGNGWGVGVRVIFGSNLGFCWIK